MRGIGARGLVGLAVALATATGAAWADPPARGPTPAGPAATPPTGATSGPPAVGPARPASAREPRLVAPRQGFEAAGFELHDVSAWTLRAGELEVSPEALRLGIGGFLEVGSYFPLDAVGALNAELAATFFAGERVAVGGRVGFFYFDPAFVGIDSDFQLAAFPVALTVSGRPSDAVRVHGSVEYLSALPNERAPDAALRIERHLGPVGRLVLTAAGEYRFGAHFAALARIEVPIVAHRDELRYADEGAGVGDAVRAEVALHMVFSGFNLRVGGGYGPSVLGRSGFFPVAALSVRVF